MSDRRFDTATGRWVAIVCRHCGRELEWSEGADCWVVPTQALPPACRRDLTDGATVRGHDPLEVDPTARKCWCGSGVQGEHAGGVHGHFA